MKTNNRFSFLFIVAVIFVAGTIQGQNTHYVTIHVNTEQINSQNALEVCYFTSESPDGNVVRSEDNIKDFTTFVAAGDIIIWKGISSNNPDNDTVNVSSINYHGGDNVFDRNVLNGNGGSPEEVEAMVQPGTNGKTEKYTIKFKVLNSGISNGGTFQIDPKIAVKP